MRKLQLKVSINPEQKLYVLSYVPILKNGKEGKRGGYVTCHGFENVNRDVKIVADWLRANGQELAVEALAPFGRDETPSVAFYDYYKAIMRLGSLFHSKTGNRCEGHLTPQLKGLEGKRVEVFYKDGSVSRFKVGRSTGWMPCHLEIANSRSHGGGAAFGEIERVKLV